MYPELLPTCAMKARGPRDRVFFTKAEDNLLALGLKHFEGTDFSKQLISKYLLTAKTSQQLTVRIKNLTMKKAPENIFKFYKRTEVLPALSKCCEDVQPQDAKPPVEREKHRLPFWIKASLSSIEAEIKKLGGDKTCGDSKYPLQLPPGVTLTLKPLPRSFFRRAWRQKKSTLKPLLIRPSAPKPPAKSPSQTLPIRIFGQVPPPVVQPAVPTQGISALPMGPKVPEVCFPIAAPKQPSQVPTATVTHVPLTHDKLPMSALPSQTARKPLICGVLKKKMVTRASGVKAAPLVHSGPLLFALPSGALKLVSLGTPCGVLQPVNAGTGVHVATVLLNSSQMPLNQTFTQTLVSTPCEVSDNFTSPAMDADVESIVKKEEDEWDCVSITIKVEADESHATAGEGGEHGVGGDNGSPNEDSKYCGDHPSLSMNKPPEESIRELVSLNEEQADLKTEIGDVRGMPELQGEPVELDTENENIRTQPGDMQEPENVTEDDHTEGNEPQNLETSAVEDSPKNTSSSTDGDVEMSSPAGVPIDSSSPLDGQEMDNEKDVPEEEEEEEEFDLTQDEDEMSSASEESVLSVPELQETMEKLTWLASERRLSQEGDSEDNSQEENTEPEEEEEEEAEIIEGSLQKAEGMTDEASKESEKLVTSHLSVPSPTPVETSIAPVGERRRGGSKAQGSHRARSRRGRARASKDASKLLLLYDEKILMKDPLRDQKDMAFAQSYLSRVREALQSVPGTYEEFLNLIYEFETRRDKRTAVELYESLRQLLHDWPQLLKDFAAFLLPEQALECGLFEEQQAFDKSRRFLRQLEICFLENPAQHQKIIKLLQSCAECPLQEIGKLKTQMWQLLRGHIHLQEEFSLFFDQLRPPASRMEDFEVMNWTEEKEYKFDGFEEVTLPDVEEEEEQNKRHKRRKESGPGQDKVSQRFRELINLFQTGGVTSSEDEEESGVGEAE
ncbi:GON-4-like protein [Pseudophryne corroboree]|uniref:GON-4-like protein n=1 Tax=Pseudophryne corroboree TaxID=495146 RepID=UPI00308129AE